MAQKHADQFAAEWRAHFPDLALPQLSCLTEHEKSLDFEAHLLEGLANSKQRVAQLERELKQQQLIAAYLERLAEATRTQSEAASHGSDLLTVAGSMHRPPRPKSPLAFEPSAVSQCRKTEIFPSKHSAIDTASGSRMVHPNSEVASFGKHETFSDKIPSPSSAVSIKIGKSESLSVGTTSKPEMSSSACVRTESEHTSRSMRQVESAAKLVSANAHERTKCLRKSRSTDDTLCDTAESVSAETQKRTLDDEALRLPYHLKTEEYEYVWDAQSGSQKFAEAEHESTTPSSSMSQSQDDIDDYLADETSEGAHGDTLKYSDIVRRRSDDADTLRREMAIDDNNVAQVQHGDDSTETKPDEQEPDDTEDARALTRPARSIRGRRMTVNDRLSLGIASIPSPGAGSVDLVDVDTNAELDGRLDVERPAEAPNVQGQTTWKEISQDVISIKSTVAKLKSEHKTERRSVDIPQQGGDARPPPLPPRASRADVIAKLEGATSGTDQTSPPKQHNPAVATRSESTVSSSSIHADELERIEVLTKVLDNEALYLDVLDVLNQYMKSMEASATTSARFMPLESVQAIFSRIRDLYSLHKQFYDHLNVRVQQAQVAIQGVSVAAKPPNTTQRPLRTAHAAHATHEQPPTPVELRVADLFLPLISQLNVAREYANNYSRAVHTVKRYTVENAQFAELARAIRLKRSKEVCTLETLLFKPVLRMQRHIDILRELLAATRPSHPDHAELEAMLKIAQQTVSSSMSQAAAQVTQPSSATSFIGGHTMDSFSPGSLVRASLMVELVHDSRKLRHVFLFSNLFVCAKLNQQTDQFEIKWFVPLRELIVYKVDDNLQEDTRTKRRAEISAIKQRIAALRSELRRELHAAEHPPGTDARKSVISSVDATDAPALIGFNMKEGPSMWNLPGLRAAGPSSSQQSAAQKSVERLRKKLAEQKAALVLASPSLLFELSRNSEKRYRFVMSSKFERDDWKAQIKTLRNRLLPSYSLTASEATPRITVLEVKALIESCRLVSPQVNELGKVLLACDADLLGEEHGDLDESAIETDPQTQSASGSAAPVRLGSLSGSLFVTVCSLECPAHRNSDLFVCLEVDSHGQFDLQARTRLMRNTTDRVVFDQEFELALDASQTVRLLCYGRSQSLGEYLIAHADFGLLRDFRSAENERSFTKRQLTLRPVSNDDKHQPVLECSMRYVAPEQTIKRSAPGAAPSNTTKSSLFGAPLDAVCKRERSRVPVVLRVCIEEVERRGLLEVGIYRISGANSEVQDLRRTFERNATAASQTLADRDIHTVSNILKLFLRELPEPLFTDQLYRSVVDGYQLPDPAVREKCILSLLLSLPPPNYTTLMCLFDHLSRIAEHANENRMTLQNLSTVFGPSLLRPAFRNELIQGRLDAGAGAQHQPLLSLSKLTQDAIMEASVVLYCIELRKRLRGTPSMPTDEDDWLTASAPASATQTPSPHTSAVISLQSDTVDSPLPPPPPSPPPAPNVTLTFTPTPPPPQEPSVTLTSVAAPTQENITPTDQAKVARLPKHDLSVVHRIDLVHGATQRIRDRDRAALEQSQVTADPSPPVAAQQSSFKQAQSAINALFGRSTQANTPPTTLIVSSPTNTVAEAGVARHSVAAALNSPVQLPPINEATPSPVATVSPTESTPSNTATAFHLAQANIHAYLSTKTPSQRGKPPPPPVSSPPRKPTRGPSGREEKPVPAADKPTDAVAQGTSAGRAPR